MTILYWIVVGFIVGVLAKWVMPGKDPGGFIVTVLIGIAGAVVGGFISNLLGISGGVIVSLLFAVGGGVLLLFAWRKINGGSA
ncbi:MAG: GlsB/YeaQ/YmgE family stress response membrane protein [Nevskiales bacterium]